MQSQYISFDTGGFVLGEIPEELRPTIKDLIKSAREKKIPFNHILVGHIKEEYEIGDLIQDRRFVNYILSLTNLYNQEYPVYQKQTNILVDNGPFAFTPPWVNIQKKGEFNPPHTHSGLYSYVIWVDTPYNIEDEKNMFITANKECDCGKFAFIFYNTVGHLVYHYIPVDYSWNWKVSLFPSNLTHMVNPFFSTDKERISIAGNILIANESL